MTALDQDVASSHYLTYAINPIKVIMMELEILSDIDLKFPMLKFKTKDVKELLLQIAGGIIDGTDVSEDLVALMTDKLYNGLEVIDMIAYLNLTELLMSEIMDHVVSSFFEGPYERSFFLKGSTQYIVIDSIWQQGKIHEPKGHYSNLRNPRFKFKSKIGIKSMEDVMTKLNCTHQVRPHYFNYYVW
jgi:hypothetical protein